jgi:excisionase family DNA binding protein
VAEWLKVNPQTVRNFIDREQLRAVYVGARRVRVRQSDVERFLVAGETQPPDEDDRGPAQPELAEALREALGAAESADAAELIPALRRLAATAESLADALEDADRR